MDVVDSLHLHRANLYLVDRFEHLMVLLQDVFAVQLVIRIPDAVDTDAHQRCPTGLAASTDCRLDRIDIGTLTNTNP